MTSPSTGARIVSLDLLRGLAVAGMILVDSPGSWSKVYAPLEHAAWHGLTAADLVFPTFLFCAGMAIGLMVPRLTAEARASSAFWLKVARRTGLLILLGLAINLLGNGFDLAHLRFPGILQRIGVCYALATVICVWTARRGEGGRLVFTLPAAAGAAIVLLGTYWLLVAFVPVPGFGVGRLNSYGSLPAFVDRHGATDQGADLHKIFSIGFVPLGDVHLFDPADRAVIATMAIVSVLILLIAIINYVNLATARAGLRAREVAVRKVLGQS